eukprot:GFYU01005325.1.p1 GENE.GFYU01005325.1~~GFYU01005325.1.p1  ORF type:complete len:506 (+),score=153.05 GFYU01005325.1:362-1879(+)
MLSEGFVQCRQSLHSALKMRRNKTRAGRMVYTRLRVGAMISMAVLVMGTAAIFGVFSEDSTHSRNMQYRKLMSSASEELAACDTESVGMVGAYLVIMVYSFLGLAIICDDYFVTALEKISEALDLSEDVAGATFMAAGSSAPELATSMVGVFFAESDVGVGTIVGSAIFNILVIIGLSAALSGQTLVLEWWPLARDSSFYAASVAIMLGSFDDAKVDWYEAFILLILYTGYCLIMKYNERIQEKLKSGKVSPEEVTGEDANAAGEEAAVGEIVKEKLGSNPQIEGAEPHNEVTIPKDGEDEDDGPWYAFPGGVSGNIYHVFALPYLAMFTFSVPDAANEEKFGGKAYILSFIMSIVYIGGLSWVMVFCAEKIGCLLDINTTVMGVTVLAAGTSVPDALSSLSVAKDGAGVMAVSNAIGSNVFDICLGLGFPWFLKSIIESGDPIKVSRDDLLLNGLILFGILMIVIGSILFTKWKLHPTVGYFFFSLYICYVIFVIVKTFAFDRN